MKSQEELLQGQVPGQPVLQLTVRRKPSSYMGWGTAVILDKEDLRPAMDKAVREMLRQAGAKWQDKVLFD